MLIFTSRWFGTGRTAWGDGRCSAWGAFIGLVGFPAFWLMSYSGHRPVDSDSPSSFRSASSTRRSTVRRRPCSPNSSTRECATAAFRSSTSSRGSSPVGLTPIIATALLRQGDGQPWLVAGYMLVVGLISTASVLMLKESRHADLVAPIGGFARGKPTA